MKQPVPSKAMLIYAAYAPFVCARAVHSRANTQGGKLGFFHFSAYASLSSSACNAFDSFRISRFVCPSAEEKAVDSRYPA